MIVCFVPDLGCDKKVRQVYIGVTPQKNEIDSFSRREVTPS
jgi:hypothetical protein